MNQFLIPCVGTLMNRIGSTDVKHAEGFARKIMLFKFFSVVCLKGNKVFDIETIPYFKCNNIDAAQEIRRAAGNIKITIGKSFKPYKNRKISPKISSRLERSIYNYLNLIEINFGHTKDFLLRSKLTQLENTLSEILNKEIRAFEKVRNERSAANLDFKIDWWKYLYSDKPEFGEPKKY